MFFYDFESFDCFLFVVYEIKKVVLSIADEKAIALGDDRNVAWVEFGTSFF